VRHLTQRRAEIEEAELEVMEEQEPIDAALAILVEDRAQLQATADVLRSEVVAAEAVVDAELASVIVARAAEAKRLPTELSDRLRDPAGTPRRDRCRPAHRQPLCGLSPRAPFCRSRAAPPTPAR